METPKSRFNVSKAQSTSCGQKTNQDIRPELTAERAANRITLNSKASSLLGCKGGDYIKVFKNPDAEETCDLFAIAIVTADVAGSAKLTQTGKEANASVGRPCSCSYSGVWSYMIQNDINAEALSITALQSKGIAQEYDTMTKLDGTVTSAVLTNINVSYELQLLEEDCIVDGIHVEKLYALVDPTVTELDAPSVAVEREKDLEQVVSEETASKKKAKATL